jgi:hypothetical protein
MTTTLKTRNLATGATFVLAAAATVLLASTASAQSAIPPNDWLNSAVKNSAPKAPAAPSTVSRVEVQAQAAKAAPSPFADSYPSRGSVHNARFTPQLTRAEVMADAQIWRESGLALLDAGEAPDRDNVAYRQAQAKYDELRASPYFAALVQRFGAEPQRLALSGR